MMAEETDVKSSDISPKNTETDTTTNITVAGGDEIDATSTQNNVDENDRTADIESMSAENKNDEEHVQTESQITSVIKDKEIESKTTASDATVTDNEKISQNEEDRTAKNDVEKEKNSNDTKDNEEKDIEKDEKDDDEESSEEGVERLQAGLLERPYVIEKGVKRERKKVDRLSSSMTSPKEPKQITIKEGSGIKLGNIPYIEYQLQKTNNDELKLLHKLLFTLRPKPHEVKKHIRQFNGFTFEKDGPDYEKKMDVMGRYTLPGLVSVCETLGVEHVGRKDAIMERAMDFLMKPVDHGKPIPEKKKKKAVKQPKVKQKRSSTKTSKTKAKEKGDGGGDNDDDESMKESDEEGEKEDDEETGSKGGNSEEDQESGVESDEEESPKKKVKKDVKEKKETKKSETLEKSAKKKVTAKESKKETPKQTKKRKSEVADDSISNTKQKKSKQPPSNDELKEKIKKILDTADFEQVTMKTVIRDVHEMYPDFDLSDRKAFMKNVVRQLIS